MTSPNPDNSGKEITPYQPQEPEKRYRADAELWTRVMDRIEHMMLLADERDGNRADLRWSSDELRKDFTLLRSYIDGETAPPCYTLSIYEMFQGDEPARLRVSRGQQRVRPVGDKIMDQLQQGFFKDDAENAEFLLLCYLSTHPNFPGE